MKRFWGIFAVCVAVVILCWVIPSEVFSLGSSNLEPSNFLSSATSGEINFTEHIVTTNVPGARYVYAADIDGDGDSDMVSASSMNNNVDEKTAWYENVSGDGTVWTTRLLSSVPRNQSAVHTSDLDSDGDMDILTGWHDAGYINWYENDGQTPPNFTYHSISSGVNGIFSIVTTDLDEDGDVDVLTTSHYNNTVAWHENMDGNGLSWSKHNISTTADGTRSVDIADLDGDGDTDVLSTSVDDDKLAWYENDGQATPGFSEHIISTSIDGARSVFATDVNGDNDIDILVAGLNDNTISWFENDGNSNPNFTSHVITSTFLRPVVIYAEDIDGDGDEDVMATNENDILWFENDGGINPNFTKHTIFTGVAGARTLYTIDIDADGDMDVAAGSGASNISWWENLGKLGNIDGLTATNDSPTTLGNTTTLTAVVSTTNPIDNIMSDAWLVEHLSSQATVDIDALVIDPDYEASNQDGYAVWEVPLRQYSQAGTVLPTLDVNIRYALSPDGDFYVGSVGTPSEALSVLVGHNEWWVKELSLRDIMLYGYLRMEYGKLENDFYVSGGDGLNGSLEMWNHYGEPVHVAYSAIMMFTTYNGEYQFVENLDVWDPSGPGATTYTGNTWRQLDVSCDDYSHAFVFSHAYNDNGNSTYVKHDGVTVAARGGSIGADDHILLDNCPSSIELGGYRSWSEIDTSVHMAIVGGSLTSSNYAEYPTNGGNPPPSILTIPPDENITYTWDLGDGNTASGAVVNHIYEAAGVYTATVTANNSTSVVTATTIVTIDTHNQIDLTVNSPLVTVDEGETAVNSGTVTASSSSGLDASFGNNGRVINAISSNDDRGQAMALQTDGKIIVAGYTGTTPNRNIFVTRYNVDGTLDTSFGNDGLVLTDLGYDEVLPDNAITIQDDGKILVAGYTTRVNTYYGAWAIARYNPDGSLDMSFGTNGVVTLDLGSSRENPHDIAVQGDGKILISGVMDNKVPGIFALVRLHSDGNLDTTFDGDGKVFTSFAPWYDIPSGNLHIQPDNKYILTGYTQSAYGVFNLGMARYNNDGSLDTSFGSGGKVATDLGFPVEVIAASVLQSDGKILAAGYGGPAYYNYDLILARYLSNGVLDTTFGEGGYAIVDLGSSDDFGMDLELLSDGRFIVAGSAQDDFALLRFNSDGSLDTTFDDDGIALIDAGGGIDSGQALVVQPDGNLVVAGSAHNGTDYDMAMIRYQPDGVGEVTLTASIGSINNYGDGTWDWHYDTVEGPTNSQPVTITATTSGSATAQVTFALVVNNVPPTVTLTGEQNTHEGTTSNFSFVVTDPGADTFILLDESCGPDSTLSHAIFDSNNGSGSFDCTFLDGPTIQTVSVTISDDEGDSNNGTLAVTVNNVAPSADAGEDNTVFRNDVVTITGTWTDPANTLDNPFIWSWDLDGDGLPDDSGNADFGEAITRSTVFAVDGLATLTFTVTDKDGGTVTDTINIEVVNRLPIADNQSISTDEDMMEDITLTASDPDNDTLSFILLTNPANGILTGTLPSMNYIPNPDFYGSDSFTFKVNDGLADSNEATVDITVTPVNDPPQAIDDTATTDEDIAVVINAQSNDNAGPSNENPNLTTTTVTDPPHGTAIVNQDETIAYYPDFNFNGIDDFNYTVCDSDGACATATITVLIAMVNDPPDAEDDTVTTPEDTYTTIYAATNDIDVDGNLAPNSVLALSQPTQGSLTNNGDGSFGYMPSLDFHGSDSFTYQICDMDGVCDDAIVNITITPVNDVPVCTSAVPSSSTLWPPNHQFEPITISGILDVEADPITILIDSIFQDELVDSTGDGSYVPDGQGIGSDTAQVRAERSGNGNGRFYHIGFTASDGQGGNCSGIVQVSVPKSQGKKGAAIDEGSLYDSTIP